MIEILKKPVITEKSEKLIETNNTYTFEVDQKATKDQIKEAIESLYDVKVDKINTIKGGGGKKNMRYTNQGVIYQKRRIYKKALVKLADGDEIDFYSNI